MEGSCPRCHVRLELPNSGLYECERCRLRFEAAVGAPRLPAAGPHPAGFFPGAPMGGGMPAAMQAPLDPSQQTPCAQHPGNPATHICERCGDFMCRLCTTPVEGRLYCPKCFDLLYDRGALQFAQRQFTLPGLSFGLGISGAIMSVLCSCINLIASVPLGIAGLWVGIRALKEMRQRPELPNRGLAIWGIVCSVVAILVSVGQLGFWIWTFTRNN
jgi:hypothetical protein